MSNAAHQNRKKSLDVDDAEWDRTFKTNVYAYFWLVKAALSHAGALPPCSGSDAKTGVPGHAAILSRRRRATC